jgi:hypothetical protein
LLNVGDEILYVLDTYREADEVGSYTWFAELLIRELAMSVACGVAHTRASVSHVGNDADELQAVHEAASLVA